MQGTASLLKTPTMKTNILKTLLLSGLAAGLMACESLLGPAPDGELRLRFSHDLSAMTRSAEEIPDTNDFILNVTDSKGKSVYSGKYGDSPESLLVTPGSYTVSVRSSDLTKPAFSAPVYGDEQVVVVASSKVSTVTLNCTLQNCGVRLKIASNFLTTYPNATLHLKDKTGSLLYAYKEKRIAYFQPGDVSLVLSEASTDKTLLTRTLEAKEVLTLNISAPAASSAAGGLRIEVDTAKTWLSENYTIGSSGSGSGSSGGSSMNDALSVAQARSSAGAEDVWVTGYIVGGNLTASGMKTSGTFTSKTNIVLAARSSTTDKSSCLSVQLDKGDIRDALNLVDNPENLGCRVYLKGDIVEAYYGIPGMKNLTEFELR
jgi:hypothetical protein